MRFVPHGDGKQILDITVVIVPMQRFENQVVWNAWYPNGSKEAYIDNYNANWERTRKHNPKVDDMLLDKAFYLK